MPLAPVLISAEIHQNVVRKTPVEQSGKSGIVVPASGELSIVDIAPSSQPAASSGPCSC